MFVCLFACLFSHVSTEPFSQLENASEATEPPVTVIHHRHHHHYSGISSMQFGCHAHSVLHISACFIVAQIAWTWTLVCPGTKMKWIWKIQHDMPFIHCSIYIYQYDNYSHLAIMIQIPLIFIYNFFHTFPPSKTKEMINHNSVLTWVYLNC